MKKIKRVKSASPPVARPSEQKPMMSLEQIEERLVKSVLSGTLALHLLRNSRTPTSRLVKDLVELEHEVGLFVGQAMQMHVENLKASSMNGILAGALSFIPLGQPSPGLALRSSNLANPSSDPKRKKQSRSRKPKRKTR